MIGEFRSLYCQSRHSTLPFILADVRQSCQNFAFYTRINFSGFRCLMYHFGLHVETSGWCVQPQIVRDQDSSHELSFQLFILAASAFIFQQR